MTKNIACLLVISILCVSTLQAQSIVISGLVTDNNGNPVENVNVVIKDSGIGTMTDNSGYFKLSAKSKEIVLVISHLKYEKQEVALNETTVIPLKVVLREIVHVLDQVEIKGDQINIDTEVSRTTIDPVQAKKMPSPFQNISAIITTLPGVASNNELSSTYRVRGGNFDENLVYVNDMPIYRPFLMRSGQQEGLGFVNTDLVSNIDFASGGWAPEYGDGLSSVLNIKYKKPETFGGSVSLGLLGGSANIEGKLNSRTSYLLGIRNKSSEYLLNTLETKGEYKPKFTDIQTLISYDLSPGRNTYKTDVEMIFSYARNRFLVQPTNRESTFGTFNDQKRIYVGFDGRDKLTYDIWQGGVKLNTWFFKKIHSHFLVSGVLSKEREYFDVESGYRLCNVDNDPSSSTFNKCVLNIGIGTQYTSGRNQLNAKLINIEMRNEVAINDNNTMEFGIGYSWYEFSDRINEYGFTDSSDYVTITEVLNSNLDIDYYRLHGYWQNTSHLTTRQSLTYGLRAQYQSFNDQWLISPRIQYNVQPFINKETYIRAAVGLYQQAPLYKELRNKEGEINKDVKAQSSFHSIVGMDINFKKWGRPFKFTTEVYYKYLWNVIPYDVENVRIRYFGDNMAKAYAGGIDFRISGEFIPGDESWFSLGLLTTKEDLENDTRGFIPRPSDQIINFGVFFQDHIPNDPTTKIHVRLLYASGLPFSPPNNPEYRNYFRGGEYQRLDVGFSKMIYFNKKEGSQKLFKSLWLGAEILNLTGHQNVISYYWVKDVYNYYYAVPNTLSARFFNLRLILDF